MKTLRHGPLRPGLLILALALAPACGGASDENEPKESDGSDADAGTPPKPSAGGSGSSGSTSPDAKRCTPSGKTLWDHADTFRFEVSHDEVFFVDGSMIEPGVDALLGPGAEIRKVTKDGTSTVLYTISDPKQQRIGSHLWVDEEDIYFFMSDRGLEPPLDEDEQLYRISRNGGTPARISSAERGYSGIGTIFFGSDAEALYVHGQEEGVLARISKTTGLPTIIFEEPKPKVIMQPQIHDGKIWFLYHGKNTIWWVPQHGEHETATLFAKDACGVSFFPRLAVSDAGTLCGGERHALDGTDITPQAPPAATSTTAFMSGAVVFHTSGQLFEMDPSTLASKPIACGQPTSGDEVRMDGSTVYWLEKRFEGRTEIQTLKSAPRPRG